MRDDIDWNRIARDYRIGRSVVGSIVDVWPSGAIVELEPGLSGLLRNGELSWDAPISDAREVLRRGQSVKVQILGIERWHGRLSLSLRRAQQDPWLSHASQYIKGKQVRARVLRFTREETLVECEDHVFGRIPREEMGAGPKPEELLEVGDWVEAEVLGRDGVRREAILSLRARLEAIDEEVRKAWLSEDGESYESDYDLQHLDAAGAGHSTDDSPAAGRQKAGGLVGAFTRILVVENDENERFQLCAMLEDLGLESPDEATSEDDVVNKTLSGHYDLVLMDISMPEADREAGIRAARRILATKPKAIVVLVSGTGLSSEDRAWAEEHLRGLIPKPFTLERLASALKRLRETGHAGWPPPPPAGGPDLSTEAQFMVNIGRSLRQGRRLAPILEEELLRMVNATGGDAAALISWHPQTQEVRLEASVEIQEKFFLACKANLYRSPVTDLVYGADRFLYYNDIEMEAEGKFRYLRPILGPKDLDGTWPLQACLGELVHAGVDLVYTLFLFGKDTGRFAQCQQALVRATAVAMGAAIREHWILQKVAADQRLMSLGGVIGATSHELRGRLTALESVNSVRHEWEQIRSNHNRLSDPQVLERMTKRIDHMATATEAMNRTVAALMGWVMQDSGETMVDVHECIQNAVNACRQEARDRGVVVRTRCEPVPHVPANRTEIEQALLNVLLNAIHNIRCLRRRKGIVVIETSYSPAEERPIRIRISDTGSGIHSRHIEAPQDEDAPIFQPMFTTKARGAGMGLYITRGLLGNSEGTIKVDRTAMLAGTTFLIELRERR